MLGIGQWEKAVIESTSPGRVMLGKVLHPRVKSQKNSLCDKIKKLDFHLSDRMMGYNMLCLRQAEPREGNELGTQTDDV